MFILDRVRYKHILRVNHLCIPGGKVTAIVGESGSGKTTLLRHLNHLTSPDHGTVTFRGEDLSAVDPVMLRRQVVMLPQHPPVFPGTVRENLLIGLVFAERPLLADDRLHQVLARVHLAISLGQPAEQLSGGEQQRLALARILLMEPEVLLLDEPSSSLDEDTADLVIESLVSFSRERSKTLVMVTHSRLVARRYAEFMVEMKVGADTSAGDYP